MKYNFDEENDRRGNQSVKWEFVRGDEGLPEIVFSDL